MRGGEKSRKRPLTSILSPCRGRGRFLLNMPSLKLNYCWVAFIGMLLFSGLLARYVCAAEPAAPAASRTIVTEEVKDDAAEAEQKVSLAQVEKSRVVTGDRLYGLAGLWLLIALVIFLIRYQIQDDEKLYREGYYNKDLE